VHDEWERTLAGERTEAMELRDLTWSRRMVVVEVEPRLADPDDSRPSTKRWTYSVKKTSGTA